MKIKSPILQIFISWIALRFVELISFIGLFLIWGFILKDSNFLVSGGEGKSIIKLISVWVAYAFFFLYFPISLICFYFNFKNQKLFSRQNLNWLIFVIHSALVDIYLMVSSDTKSAIFNFFLIWVGLIIVNYFSPKILPQSLKLP